MFLSSSLQNLIQHLAQLPGLGQRSAKRIALHLIKNQAHTALCQSLEEVALSHSPCSQCGYIDNRDPCFFCTCSQRDPGIICIVAESAHVWALEKAAFFKGHYHVLGGVLSALQGKGPEALFLSSLNQRLITAKEVILALDSTMEGQSTLHYIVNYLEEHSPHVLVSCLARGIPIGGELEALDSGTLMSAFVGRHRMQQCEELGGWLNYTTHTTPSVTSNAGLQNLSIGNSPTSSGLES